MSHYFSDADDEILYQNYIQVLQKLSDQPNYTGISARLHLAKGYLIERELEMAKTTLDDISSVAKQVSEDNHDLPAGLRSEEHTSELQSRGHLVCRLLLEKKNSY